jgi:acetyl/propionyl-CoA carboxylase alpha subunit
MRRVASVAELPAALAAGSAEATSAFGDGSVYLELEIQPARHIEVQLFGDRQGTIVALGERDCSLQRRHQKLIEESPAPGLDGNERRELHETAIRAARAARLENAATAEFLFDTESRFWFLEVNTRLQVEHGVTELVADVDLVREQLFVAAGRPLSERIRAAAERAAEPDRHAIEVRLSAEDPARDFAPAPGRIGRWEMPAGPGVRVDTAVTAGERVPPEYDPLIAKILVVDADRPAAIGRLARALEETVVTGIQTTLPFHRSVISDPGFRAGGLTTDWVDEHWAATLVPSRTAALEAARWAAADLVASPANPAAMVDAVPPAAGSGPVASEWARAGRARAVDRWPP